jgi:hypothetical protein
MDATPTLIANDAISATRFLIVRSPCSFLAQTSDPLSWDGIKTRADDDSS